MSRHRGLGFCCSTFHARLGGRDGRQRPRIDRVQPPLSSEHPLQETFPSSRAAPIPLLPSKHFINLTNGVEALRVVRERLGVRDPMFVRLQSSLCEQAAYEKILLETDHNLLAHLATGHVCYVYDLASRSKRYGVPRAIWYGLEFIRFACTYCWFGEDALPEVVLLRGKNVSSSWRHVLRHEVGKPVRQRLKYYREFVAELGVQEVRAFGVVGSPTYLDGCKEIHAKMVRDSYEAAARDAAGAGDPGFDEAEFHARLGTSGLRVFNSNDSFEHNLEATSQIPAL